MCVPSLRRHARLREWVFDIPRLPDALELRACRIPPRLGAGSLRHSVAATVLGFSSRTRSCNCCSVWSALALRRRSSLAVWALLYTDIQAVYSECFLRASSLCHCSPSSLMPSTCIFFAMPSPSGSSYCIGICVGWRDTVRRFDPVAVGVVSHVGVKVHQCRRWDH